MQIYLHSSQSTELQLIEVEETLTVRDLAAAHGPGGEGSVWVEDQDDALEVDLTLGKAGIVERGHVHISKCRRVKVRVRYGGDDKVKDFAPGATIARVFKWATGKKGFDLTPSERAKHTLGICDTLTEPDKAEHVGSLASDQCALCLDLAPKERFEG